jgi:hypothetical protein
LRRPSRNAASSAFRAARLSALFGVAFFMSVPSVDLRGYQTSSGMSTLWDVKEGHPEG